MSTMKEAINADKLMFHNKNQYMAMTRAKEWHTMPNENQKILALTAANKDLKFILQ